MKTILAKLYMECLWVKMARKAEYSTNHGAAIRNYQTERSHYVLMKPLNGFEKTLYMNDVQLMEHGKRYSKSFTSDRDFGSNRMS